MKSSCSKAISVPKFIWSHYFMRFRSYVKRRTSHVLTINSHKPKKRFATNYTNGRVGFVEFLEFVEFVEFGES